MIINSIVSLGLTSMGSGGLSKLLSNLIMMSYEMWLYIGKSSDCRVGGKIMFSGSIAGTSYIVEKKTMFSVSIW